MQLHLLAWFGVIFAKQGTDLRLRMADYLQCRFCRNSRFTARMRFTYLYSNCIISLDFRPMKTFPWRPLPQLICLLCGCNSCFDPYRTALPYTFLVPFCFSQLYLGMSKLTTNQREPSSTATLNTFIYLPSWHLTHKCRSQPNDQELWKTKVMNVSKCKLLFYLVWLFARGLGHYLWCVARIIMLVVIEILNFEAFELLLPLLLFLHQQRL